MTNDVPHGPKCYLTAMAECDEYVEAYLEEQERLVEEQKLQEKSSTNCKNSKKVC